MNLPESPPSPLARTLGVAGLIPFLAGALAVWLAPPGWRLLAANALLAYGALIVSFLGGIHWGLVMRGREAAPAQLVWGITPSLLAWAAVLMDVPWGLWLTAASLVACLAVDRMVYARQGVAAWIGLRTLLTVVAASACVLAALKIGLR
ncbi:MAG: DUF3429 domain-containing protein [Pseudomonadota bacterium]